MVVTWRNGLKSSQVSTFEFERDKLPFESIKAKKHRSHVDNGQIFFKWIYFGFNKADYHMLF